VRRTDTFSANAVATKKSIETLFWVYPDFATIIYRISSELKNPIIVEDPFVNDAVLTAECG
jgi:hypothetical protein